MSSNKPAMRPQRPGSTSKASTPTTSTPSTEERRRRLGPAGRARRRLCDLRRLRRLELGLAQGGWGGMFLATLLMATMYLCMCFSLAELSSMIPTAGGAAASPAAPSGLGRLSHRHRDPHRIRHRPGGHRLLHRRLLRVAVRRRRLADLPGVLHRVHRHPHPRRRRGAEADVRHHRGGGHRPRRVHCRDGSALRLGQPVQHPADRGYRRQQLPAVRLCRGLGGDPYAIWFFLAVEGVPLAAEETKNPKRDLPRGLIGAMLVLLAFAALILVVGPGPPEPRS